MKAVLGIVDTAAIGCYALTVLIRFLSPLELFKW